MNKCRPESGANRRQFLRDGVRLAILGGLAAIGGKLAGRLAAGPPARSHQRRNLPRLRGF